jgi:hypothetical protein
MPTNRRVLPLLVLSLLAACGDDDNLPEPTERNRVDTVTIGSLTDTPITTASGFAVTSGPIRTDLTSAFDFAYDIRGVPETGQSVLLPRLVLGLPSGGTAEPGLMRRDEAFDAIEVAPSNGYVTDEEVPIAIGERYIVRSQISCVISVPYYAKIEIIGLEDNSVVLKVLANRNCGYRGLEPGFPER